MGLDAWGAAALLLIHTWLWRQVLMLAASRGALGSSRLLVATGAQVKQESKDGATAVDIAAATGHSEVAKYLASVPEQEKSGPQARAVPSRLARGAAGVVGGSKRALPSLIGPAPVAPGLTPASAAAEALAEAPAGSGGGRGGVSGSAKEYERFASKKVAAEKKLEEMQKHTPWLSRLKLRRLLVQVAVDEVDPETGQLSIAALTRIRNERKASNKQAKFCCAGVLGVIVTIILVVVVAR